MNKLIVKIIIALGLGWIPIIILSAFFLFGCTINMQNTDTHGKTEDLIDEQLTNTADLSFPVG